MNEKANYYLIAIVAIVAIVGIVVLVLQVGSTVPYEDAVQSQDILGYAVVAPGTPAPDLVYNDAVSSGSMSGTVYGLSDGTIVYSAVAVTLTAGVLNQGTAAVPASALSQHSAKLIYSGKEVMGFNLHRTSTELRNLAVGNTVTFTSPSGLFSTSSRYGGADLIRELYNNNTANITLNISVDSREYRTYGINETNETNNNVSLTVPVTSAGITFVEVECATNADCTAPAYCNTQGRAYECVEVECTVDADCPSGCGCNANNCYQVTTSGSSTYTTTTPC